MKAQLLVWSMAIVLGVPTAAAAQGRMPHKGASAVGGEVGVFLPKEGALSTGPVVEGFYEHYLTARDSVRVGVGWLYPKFEANHSDGLRQVRLGVDVLHNWEGGAVHPYVGVGLGAYFLQFRDNGQNSGDSMTKLGGSLLGGAEFFTSKTFSVKGEARYHFVTKENEFNPSGLALSVGVKSYF